MTVTPGADGSVRRATVGDVDAIATIWRSGWIDGHVGHVPDELQRARLGGSWVASVLQRLDATWVACDRGGSVLGFVTVVGDELEQLYVARAARSSGVATLLLGHGEQVATTSGAERPWLAVAAGNTRARRFYEREGWTDVGGREYHARTECGAVAVDVRRYESRAARGTDAAAAGSRGERA